MKLCDRCRVPGCLLDYLGPSCFKARKRECPDVQPNRAEIISNMSLDEMAQQLLPMFEELCEDGIPGPDYMKFWLEQPAEEAQDNG